MLGLTQRSPLPHLILSLLLLVACGGPATRGLPSSAGEYPVQSVAFDGRQYSFHWAGPDGQLHRAQGEDLKLVQDERSFLEVGKGTPVLHLKSDEPVTVHGRDSGGGFSSVWFPFLLGYALGGGGPWVTVPQTGPPGTTPSYRYPPTDKFGPGDTLHGSEATSRPAPPDYRKVQPPPNAVSGQNSGTGGGTAATNRDPAAISGQSGGAGAGSAATDRGTGAISGQSGGAGAGSAATSKDPNGAVAPGGTGAGSAATDRGRTGRTDPGVSAPSAPASGDGVTSRPSGGSAPARPGVSSSGARSGGRR
jgi:hypothetical protein